MVQKIGANGGVLWTFGQLNSRGMSLLPHKLGIMRSIHYWVLFSGGDFDKTLYAVKNFDMLIHVLSGLIESPCPFAVNMRIKSRYLGLQPKVLVYNDNTESQDSSLLCQYMTYWCVVNFMIRYHYNGNPNKESVT